MILLRRISGNSMHPTLRDGDYIVASRIFSKKIMPGDIVIVSHPIYKEIIKRVELIDGEDNLWLVGDGTDTLSTAKMGAIPRSAFMGKMIWHIQAKTELY